jgi:hypothetical protein
VQEPHVNIQQVTADNCVRFASGLPTTPLPGTWSGKNSLLVATHETGTVPGSLDATCSVLSSSNGVFLTGSDGSHYLPPGSANRATGTLALDATLLAELPQKTTSPPMTLPLLMQVSVLNGA